MKETRADTAQALLYALALHLLLFALAFLGLRLDTNPPVSAAGAQVEADLVDPNALSASMQRALRAPAANPRPTPAAVVADATPPALPPPQPQPSPVPEDAQLPPQPVAQERISQPDTREQENVEDIVEAIRTRVRARDEKHRQEQVDLTERKRQPEAETKSRLSPMEQERLKQLADIRSQRVAATHDAKVSEARLKQLSDYQARNAAEAAAQADNVASASPPPGNNGADADLSARYAAALQAAILRNWVRPDSVPLDARCDLNIRQLPGGVVVDVQVAANCPYDDLGKRSVEAAVLKAQPLPYAGFEKAFQRNLNLHFRAQEN